MLSTQDQAMMKGLREENGRLKITNMHYVDFLRKIREIYKDKDIPIAKFDELFEETVKKIKEDVG